MNEQLKPFDKVLVRDGDACEWTCNLFSHKKDNVYVCMDDSYNYCIPYEGNEHLLGTTDDAPTPKRWRAEKEAFYYFVDVTFNAERDKEMYSQISDYRYKSGNYFRTKEEAEEMASKFKQMLKGGGE